MSEHVPRDLRYTASHEWVRVEGAIATVGITDYAQQQLGDLTFVELPESGDEVASGDEIAVVESVKAASDIYAPVSGKIQAVNTPLLDDPAPINADSFGDGWLFKIEMESPEEADDLLTPDAYEGLIPDEE